ncbi:MAG TPA: deoxyguanosinetriphosphate triphosphohydrolase [Aestuariivirgaceae bacterium]|nr:deoxyguanosinetriphosphate triphosphohydrolase [Aestuariivirgaceae bacterium]
MMLELAPYATRAANARGRLHPEPESPPRSPFQRDRDRIIHSTAFRRLKHKTQVFVYHEGDHYRTRLTHSLEVAQIARSIARALGLDEDLTEALALAHDLGHTPFGHAGERELDHLMAPWGGFDHNAQGLRVVTRLERHYAAFDGLNLTLDTLEGLVKHNGPLVGADGRPIARMPATIAEFAAQRNVDLSTYAAAEAQVAALADDIAYDAHDIDDGLRAKLFDVIDLGDVPLAGEALSEVLRGWPNLARPRLVHETVRRVTSRMIADVLAETRRRLASQDPQSAADVCVAPHSLVAFSAQMGENERVLKQFLSRSLYRHPRIEEIMGRARRIVRNLFESHMNDAKLLPEEWRIDSEGLSEARYARHVCDFIAGMTDRYALECHKRLFDLDPLFR